MRLLFGMIIGVALLSSCNNNDKATESIDEESSIHIVKVKEVIQTDAYTYLFVNENDQDYWMAVGKTEMKEGAIGYYKDALEMKNFQSKVLDREFDRILFVQEISDVPLNPKSTKQTLPNNHSIGTDNEQKESIKIEPISGGISIAELYKNRNDYKDKKVMVRGQVVKFNKAIMDNNWVHLQDGTNDSGNFDLTFTTQEDMNVGDIVTLEGTLCLNKEFGASYSYELIVENASLK